MEEDYELTVQHQRRVNLKIHDVIKKEVEKLLDARLIYPISDGPWGGECASINRTLNVATRKDPLSTFPIHGPNARKTRLETNSIVSSMAFRVISRFP
ncbi:hypothetical protein Tco_0468475 [Tanacetum coccineum]